MIGLVIQWEDNWKNIQSGRDVDFEIWKELLVSFGVSLLILIDVTTYGNKFDYNRPDLKVESYGTIREALKAHSEMGKIFMCGENDVPGDQGFQYLHTLVHPLDNVLYVFGSDSSGLDFNQFEVGTDAEVVAIKKVPSVIWAICAASMVLYDRQIKRF